MTWVRLDDGFAEHPKIAALSDGALALWITGLSYCNRNLTDGFIPRGVGYGQLRYCDGNAVPAIRELESLGMWTETDGGWEVHDYLDYQPSKADVLSLREARKAAGSRGGKASSRAKDKQVLEQVLEQTSSKPQANGQAKSNPVPVPKELEASPLLGDVQRIYDHWRTKCGKTRANYAKISTARRRKIHARLREFTADELCLAIDAVAKDPWEGRSLNDDLTVIFRSHEQVDRFLEMAAATNGHHPSLSPYEQAKAWVQSAGWRLQDHDLIDELGRRGLEDGQRQRLTTLAYQLQNGAT